MTSRIIFSTLLLFFATGFECKRRSKNTSSLDKHDLEYAGQQRPYYIHRPQNYDSATAYAVILALHGGGGSPENMAEMSELNEAADKNGFIVVYPHGYPQFTGTKTSGTWNSGPCCGKAKEEDSDDVGYIKEVIARMQNFVTVDTKRIYATGISNGGMMSYKLACELADKIAAIAPVAGHYIFSDCAPSRPVAVLNFQGEEDECILINGGNCGGCFTTFFAKFGIPIEDNKWACPSLDETIATWKTSNACTGDEEETFSNAHAVCTTVGTCADDTAVTKCVIDNLGHNWPGGEYGTDFCNRSQNSLMCKNWRETVGPLSDALQANDVMWAFFKEHKLP